MTAFGLSICLIVIARKGLKSLTMLEESNETIFQMKDAIPKNSNLTCIFALLYAQILRTGSQLTYTVLIQNYTRSIPNPLYNIAHKL